MMVKLWVNLALGGLGVASLAPLLMKGGDGDDVVDETVEQINPATQVQEQRIFTQEWVTKV